MLRHINDLNVHACTLVEIVVTMLKDMLSYLSVGTGNCSRQCCHGVLTNCITPLMIRLQKKEMGATHIYGLSVIPLKPFVNSKM